MRSNDCIKQISSYVQQFLHPILSIYFAESFHIEKKCIAVVVTIQRKKKTHIENVNFHLGMFDDEVCVFVPCFIPFSSLPFTHLAADIPSRSRFWDSCSTFRTYPLTSTAIKFIL